MLARCFGMGKRGRAIQPAGSMRQRTPGSWELRAYGGVDALTGKVRYRTRTVCQSRRSLHATPYFAGGFAVLPGISRLCCSGRSSIWSRPVGRWRSTAARTRVYTGVREQGDRTVDCGGVLR